MSMTAMSMMKTSTAMMSPRTEPGHLRRGLWIGSAPFVAFVFLLAGLGGLALAGCGAPDSEDTAGSSSASGGASWSVTAWGSRYEVFPEVGPLTAGETVVAHTHVTVLDGFTPLEQGRVEIVLVGASGEQVFGADQPVRPGIFNVEIRPESAGEADVLFRISAPSLGEAGGAEEIRGGRVRIGSGGQAGAQLVAPAPKGAAGGEPLAFLKEEQWRSDFATEWVRSGELARGVSGLARVRPPAGGEATVTSPVDGVVHPAAGDASWPFPGRRFARGAPLFRVVPRIAAQTSLPMLEAELATLDAELAPARARLSRLEELLDLEATSRREVEEAAARVEALEARRRAAERDLGAARSSRQGGTAGAVTLRAPIAGQVAAVTASPGGTVAAGEPLARLVRTESLWLEVALPREAAREVATEGVTGVVLTDSEGPPLRIETGLRLISAAPEISPRTGTLNVLLEVPATSGLALGATFDAQILLGARRAGIVIPSTALVDDGGVPVVYLQLSGESFVRQEVEVVERQGDRLLVEGLTPGQRLVTRGGESIRRSSLMSSGDAHGHVH